METQSKFRKVVAVIAIVAVVAMISICFVACGDNNEGSNETQISADGDNNEGSSESQISAEYCAIKLETIGYDVQSVSGEEVEGAEEYGIEWCVDAYKKTEDREKFVAIYKFKKEADAKRYETIMKEEMNNKEDCAVKRIDDVVIFGTTQGVKDAQ